MASFKMAAYEILKKAKKTLHAKDITRIALEQNLITTEGETPEHTMHAQISVDIKKKGKASLFIRTAPGTFTINPDATIKEIKETAAEPEEPSDAISTGFIGKAGEHAVCSELLFRGYNASIMSVDTGMDLVATKENRLFNIQVKTANRNQFNMYVFDLRVSSFERNNSSRCFYVYILKDKNQRDYLILPFLELEKCIKQSTIKTVAKGTRYRINIRLRDGKAFVGNLDNDMSYYLNNWDVVK